MDAESPLRSPTKTFALRIIRLYSTLPRSPEAQVIGRQLLRSGTSVGAYYREATRARSGSEFASKIHLSLQELEETAYWLELLAEAGIVDERRLVDLLQESRELTAVLVASANTARKRK